MEPVTSADVAAAGARIRPHLRPTPVWTVPREALGLPGRAEVVRLKLDQLQPTGSFKVRGATSLLTDPGLVDTVTEAGVIAASGGNFGLAVAWAAHRLGVHATVVVPATSPRAKRDPIAALGAELVVVDGVYADAFAAAEERRVATGAAMAHAYDQAPVVAGQGTAAAEFLEQADGLDTVLVACGGGGLLAGTLAAVPTSVRVVAVETAGTATLRTALDAGKPVDIEVSGAAASALGARRIGAHAWAVRDRLHAALVVTDQQVERAQRWLWEAARQLAEPGGATALAALTAGIYEPEAGERVGVIVCGANADPAELVTWG
ncbi:MAG: serine/threonine dehydratase [Nitriliruptoraceae bacterium]